MRRFGALLRGLPWTTARVWAPERAKRAAPQPPPEKLRTVTPLQLFDMVKGG